MVGDAKETVESYLQSDFLARFTDGALLERLQIIHLAAHDAPTSRLGCTIAKGEKHAAGLVDYEDTDTDAGAG